MPQNLGINKGNQPKSGMPKASSPSSIQPENIENDPVNSVTPTMISSIPMAISTLRMCGRRRFNSPSARLMKMADNSFK